MLPPSTCSEGPVVVSHTVQAVGEVTPSDHSSENAGSPERKEQRVAECDTTPARIWEYDEMQEGLLDGSEEDSPTCTSHVEVELPCGSLLGSPADTLDAVGSTPVPGRLRQPALATVEESDDCVQEEEEHEADTASESPSAASKTVPSAECEGGETKAALASHPVDEDSSRGVAGVGTGDGKNSEQANFPDGAATSLQKAPRTKSPTRSPRARGYSEDLSGANHWSLESMDSGSSDPLEMRVERLRQYWQQGHPQQSGGNRNGKERPRSAGNAPVVSKMEHGPDAAGGPSYSASGLETPPSSQGHYLGSHRTGGQASQASHSSSGSQGAASDSECSGASRRRGIGVSGKNTFAAKTQEELRPGHTRARSKLLEEKLPSIWDMTDVMRWLQQCGFDDLIAQFVAQDVDGEVLLCLTTEELRGPDFKLSLGITKKLQKQIAILQAQEEQAKAANGSKRRSPSVSTPPEVARSARSISPRRALAAREPASETTSTSPRLYAHNPLSLHDFQPPLGHSPSKGALDTLSLVGSAAPSAAASPFLGGASCRTDLTPPSASATPADEILVKILNGISGEEEVRFPLRHQGSNSEQHFLSLLDRLCQQRAGCALSGLNWLSQDKSQPGNQFQRHKCDVGMVEALFGEQHNQKKNSQKTLLLCSVPQRPPTELQVASKIRLKKLVPESVSFGLAEPPCLRLETTPLEANHAYTVAFTHQRSFMTYTAAATLFANHRGKYCGVELSVPSEMISSSGPQDIKEGLYDVHLVMDAEYRSENRRTLSVGSAESEMSSSSTQSAATSGFIPITQRIA